jgi:subtilisin family serine protease
VTANVALVVSRFTGSGADSMADRYALAAAPGAESVQFSLNDPYVIDGAFTLFGDGAETDTAQLPARIDDDSRPSVSGSGKIAAGADVADSSGPQTAVPAQPGPAPDSAGNTAASDAQSAPRAAAPSDPAATDASSPDTTPESSAGLTWPTLSFTFEQPFAFEQAVVVGSGAKNSALHVSSAEILADVAAVAIAGAAPTDADAAAHAASAMDMPAWFARPHNASEAIVKLESDTTSAEYLELLDACGVVSVETLDSGGIQLWHLSTSFEQAYGAAGESAAFEFFQPNFTITIDDVVGTSGDQDGLAPSNGADAVPNDPSYGSLYGMGRISAPAAWNIATGGAVKVAVIDTGVDYNHPDLAANIWTNPGEIAGNGVDDDHNGFVDDIHGWDFVNNDNNPIDDNSHGTHCAGTIGAQGNNGIGVVGVNWSTQIMALKFLSASGSGSNANAIRAINYAAQMGAKVISASWGGGGNDPALSAAIANASNTLFVAAAGNGGFDGVGDNNDGFPQYPSSYPHNNIIAVASTDSSDNLSSFSNYGPTSVDLGAPGSGILSTVLAGGYGTKSGTSMATPHVSGVAALLWAYDPTLTVAEVRGAILSNVDPLASLSGKVASGGRLNAFKALQSVVEPHPPTIISGGGGDNATLARPENVAAVTTVFATDPDAGTTLTYSLVGGADQARFQINPATGALLFTTAPNFEAPADSDHNNSYIVQVRVADNGAPSLFDTQTITVNVTDVNESIAAIVALADFGGDARKDILWRADDGTVALWQMDGAQIVGNSAITTIANNWHIVGTGDFGGDNRGDILWRADSGMVALWEMNGAQIVGNNAITTIATNWHIVATGDFGGDGKSDILWRADDGTVALWEMNGAQIVGNNAIATIANNWHVVAADDFDGDRNTDILWRADDGTVALWQMNGAQIVANNAVARILNDWHIERTGDFGGDGRADILWRSDGGILALWQMDGAQIAANNGIGTTTGNWHISNAGDLSGDGRADILWRADDGAAALWQMNGAQIAANNTIAVISNDWYILG